MQLCRCGTRSGFPRIRLHAPFPMPPNRKRRLRCKDLLIPARHKTQCGQSRISRKDTELCVQRSSLSADEDRQTTPFRRTRDALRYSSRTDAIARLGHEKRRFAPCEAQHESSERPGTDANSPLKKARTRCMRVWKSSGNRACIARKTDDFNGPPKARSARIPRRIRLVGGGASDCQIDRQPSNNRSRTRHF